MAGCPVRIPLPKGRGPIKCFVRHHDAERPEEAQVDSQAAEFTPGTGGRWWVEFHIQERVISGCFWVSPRRV
jgi:hypothetical protein